MACQKFEGSSSFSDSHDTILGIALNGMCFNEYVPSGENRIAEVMLWLCHSIGPCCKIVGGYPVYRAGKLATLNDSLALYIASPQIWSSDLAVLLQAKSSPSFPMGGVDFQYVPEWSMPGKLVLYILRYGGHEIIFRIAFVDSVTPCGPRSNMDLTYYIWTTFEYYCDNYAILVLPSQTLGDKIVYVRHYQAEIGSETTRRCGRCVCMSDTSRLEYNVGCRKQERCTCVLCCKQRPSLKSAASEIVFGMYNKEKFRLNNATSSRPVEIDSDIYFEFE